MPNDGISTAIELQNGFSGASEPRVLYAKMGSLNWDHATRSGNQEPQIAEHGTNEGADIYYRSGTVQQASRWNFLKWNPTVVEIERTFFSTGETDYFGRDLWRIEGDETGTGMYTFSDDADTTPRAVDTLSVPDTPVFDVQTPLSARADYFEDRLRQGILSVPASAGLIADAGNAVEGWSGFDVIPNNWGHEDMMDYLSEPYGPINTFAPDKVTSYTGVALQYAPAVASIASGLKTIVIDGGAKALRFTGIMAAKETGEAAVQKPGFLSRILPMSDDVLPGGQSVGFAFNGYSTALVASMGALAADDPINQVSAKVYWSLLTGGTPNEDDLQTLKDHIHGPSEEVINSEPQAKLPQTGYDF